MHDFLSVPFYRLEIEAGAGGMPGIIGLQGIQAEGQKLTPYPWAFTLPILYLPFTLMNASLC